MDDKCKLCKNREEMCNDSMSMRNLCKRNGFDAFSPVTNADKIRQMSDEELAEFLAKNQKIGDVEQCENGYRQMWFDWLKQKVECDA